MQRGNSHQRKTPSSFGWCSAHSLTHTHSEPFIYIIDLLKRRRIGETTKQNNNFSQPGKKMSLRNRNTVNCAEEVVGERDRETVCCAHDDTNFDHHRRHIHMRASRTHKLNDRNSFYEFTFQQRSQTSRKEIIISHRIFVCDRKLLFLKGNISFGCVQFFFLLRLLRLLLLLLALHAPSFFLCSFATLRFCCHLISPERVCVRCVFGFFSPGFRRWPGINFFPRYFLASLENVISQIGGQKWQTYFHERSWGGHLFSKHKLKQAFGTFSLVAAAAAAASSAWCLM